MAADITQILAALEAAVKAKYLGVAVLVKAASVEQPGKVPQPGWTPGSAVPCFCISELEAETADDAGTFGYYSMGFPVAIEYVKSAAPKGWADDPDVRLKRQGLVDTFYTGIPSANLPGLPDTVFRVQVKMLPVYSANESQSVVASGIVLIYTVFRPRG